MLKSVREWRNTYCRVHIHIGLPDICRFPGKGQEIHLVQPQQHTGSGYYIWKQRKALLEKTKMATIATSDNLLKGRNIQSHICQMLSAWLMKLKVFNYVAEIMMIRKLHCLWRWFIQSLPLNNIGRSRDFIFGHFKGTLHCFYWKYMYNVFWWCHCDVTGLFDRKSLLQTGNVDIHRHWHLPVKECIMKATIKLHYGKCGIQWLKALCCFWPLFKIWLLWVPQLYASTTLNCWSSPLKPGKVKRGVDLRHFDTFMNNINFS